ncbi:MAG: hypothetical protein GX640_14575 [Fibrobacter sp.]|nr:hypothetical protein [Fibrobacter sp.]
MEWKIEVETNCGYRINGYPLRFRIGERCLEILEIEDRWFSKGFCYFKVFTDNAKHYILKRSADTGIWSAWEVRVNS